MDSVIIIKFLGLNPEPGTWYDEWMIDQGLLAKINPWSCSARKIKLNQDGSVSLSESIRNDKTFHGGYTVQRDTIDSWMKR